MVSERINLKYGKLEIFANQIGINYVGIVKDWFVLKSTLTKLILKLTKVTLPELEKGCGKGDFKLKIFKSSVISVRK